MHISDWSSDVCSTDLAANKPSSERACSGAKNFGNRSSCTASNVQDYPEPRRRKNDQETHHLQRRRVFRNERSCADRKSVVLGKSVSVRVDLAGRRSIKTKSRSRLMQNVCNFKK